MPFPGVNHAELCLTPSGEQLDVGLNRAAQLGDIVPKYLTESTRLEKVPLHIDDQQRAAFRDKIKWIRLGRDIHTRCLEERRDRTNHKNTTGFSNMTSTIVPALLKTPCTVPGGLIVNAPRLRRPFWSRCSPAKINMCSYPWWRWTGTWLSSRK